ncbi:MAG: sulfatase-like hydrolase/transferase [Planctomycetaceae bacterium]|nr:sulfatase-like hydrolase/transferase [Planctomycetaceae bacterium]
MRYMIHISFAVLFASMSTNVPETQADDRPNIILMMGDDHGWEETGYNGHPYVKTPVLDEMARTGLRLDRFHSGHSSCSPTRGSFLTGRHPNRYGTFTPGCSLRPEEITMAQLLKTAGYTTAHFGKWHLGPVKKSSPTNPHEMGFDHYISHDNFFELNPQFSINGGPPTLFEGESSEILIDETIKFIEQTESDRKPFLIVVWFGSPHEPYQGLPKDLALYDELPAKYPDQMVRLTSNETGKQTQRPLGDVLRERYAEITAMDRSIGTLRDYLKQHDLRDNTLLFYCGDNGTPRSGVLSYPLRNKTLSGQKAQIYSGGTRVPGLIEWPDRIPSPRVSAVNTVTSDLLPTVCEIANVELPQRPLDGINLVPLLDGKMSERPEPIGFWHYNLRRDSKNDPYIAPELQTGTTPLVKLSGGIPTRNFRNYKHPSISPGDYGGDRSMVDNRYKLILKGDAEDPKRELYDMREDPAETTNLAEKHPEIANRLQNTLKEWQDSVLESLTGQDY